MKDKKHLLKQMLRYISKYIYNMLCYFVSSGVEIPMTNDTFDFIWNGFGNKELNRNIFVWKLQSNFISPKAHETPMEKAGGWILQQKTERRNVFPKILSRENETTVRMRYMRFWLKL